MRSTILPICFILLLSFSGVSVLNAEEKAQSAPHQSGIWFEWNDQTGRERPWIIWNRDINWYKPPTEKEILSGYYRTKNPKFEILEYKRVEPLKVSEHVERYTLGSIFQIRVPEEFRKTMLSDGWKEVKAP